MISTAQTFPRSSGGRLGPRPLGLQQIGRAEVSNFRQSLHTGNWSASGWLDDRAPGATPLDMRTGAWLRLSGRCGAVQPDRLSLPLSAGQELRPGTGRWVNRHGVRALVSLADRLRVGGRSVNRLFPGWALQAREFTIGRRQTEDRGGSRDGVPHAVSHFSELDSRRSVRGHATFRYRHRLRYAELLAGSDSGHYDAGFTTEMAPVALPWVNVGTGCIQGLQALVAQAGSMTLTTGAASRNGHRSIGRPQADPATLTFL